MDDRIDTLDFATAALYDISQCNSLIRARSIAEDTLVELASRGVPIPKLPDGGVATKARRKCE